MHIETLSTMKPTTKAVIFLIGLSAAWAAPVEVEKTEKPPAAIIKQINQVNLDGTYTFGFEADDGSFKVETRDHLGNIAGKYGYIDDKGVLRVLQYKAGNKTGFDAKSNYLPVPLVPVQIPAKPTSPEQRALDELYQSVDDDEDGIPDTPRQRVVVSQAAPVVTISQPAVQVVRTAPVVAPVAAPVAAAVPAFNFVQPERVAVASPVAFGAPAVQIVPHEPSQREQDEQFQSVDDNQDGIPDLPRPRVRIAVPAVPVAAPAAAIPAVRFNTQPAVQFAPLGALPVAAPAVSQQFVRNPSVPNFEQLVRDLQFPSVDADEDGIPDSPAFVRLVVQN